MQGDRQRDEIGIGCPKYLIRGLFGFVTLSSLLPQELFNQNNSISSQY